jgi:hypothetical protein
MITSGGLKDRREDMTQYGKSRPWGRDGIIVEVSFCGAKEN